MSTETPIEKENSTAKEIAVAKDCAPTKEGFVRFLALEQLLKGQSKTFVAELSNRCVRTIERWIAAFNAQGIDGLALKGRPGRPRFIEAEKFAIEYVPILLDPSLGKESHWTAVLCSRSFWMNSQSMPAKLSLIRRPFLFSITRHVTMAQKLISQLASDSSCVSSTIFTRLQPN